MSEELRRVLPVVRELAAVGACVSIDTMRGAVAAAAIAAGARLVNDVSGGRPIQGMLASLPNPESLLSACTGAGIPRTCRAKLRTRRGDEVITELRTQLDAATGLGSPDKLIIDPGLGFAKTGEHRQLLQRLEEFDVLERPMLAASPQGVSWPAARRC